MFPGLLDTSVVEYSFEHMAFCLCHMLRVAPPQTLALPLISGHNGATPAVSPWCYGGLSESQWGFSAAGTAVTNHFLFDEDLPIGGADHWMEATAHSPHPASVGFAWAKAKTSLSITGTPMQNIHAEEVFAEGWMFLPILEASLVSQACMRAIDDRARYSVRYSMDADGYEPITMMDFTVAIYADGQGAVASLSDEGVTLGYGYASIVTNAFALNHGGFAGSATLDEGIFTAAGCLANLPWQFDYDAENLSRVVSARLLSDYLPGMAAAFRGSDIGDDAFWNAHPRFTMSYLLEHTDDYSRIPEPATLGLFVIGGGLFRRRER